jgi:hypothetical protein
MKMSDSTIICGVRHFDAGMRMVINSLYNAQTVKVIGQGFVDNKGNYLTREEALVIAKEQGQIIRRCGGDERELFSENLY